MKSCIDAYMSSMYITEKEMAQIEDDECEIKGEDGLCRYGNDYSMFDSITIKFFKESNKEDLYVLGKKFSLYPEFMAIVEKTSNEDSDYQVPFNGKSTVYELYYKGIKRGHFKTYSMEGHEVSYCDMEEINDDMWFFLDATQIDVAPLFTDTATERLKELCPSDENGLSYWHDLHIDKNERGKGFAEVLMRYALKKESKNSFSEGLNIQLISHWKPAELLDHNASDKEKKAYKKVNDRKQKQLNAFYEKFFRENDIEYSVETENKRTTFVAATVVEGIRHLAVS